MRTVRVIGLIASALFGLVAVLYSLPFDSSLYERVAGMYTALARGPQAVGITGYAGYASILVAVYAALAASLFAAGAASGASKHDWTRWLLLVVVVFGLVCVWNFLREVEVLGAMAFTAIPDDAYIYSRARHLTEPVNFGGRLAVFVALSLGFWRGWRVRGVASEASAHLTSAST